MPAPADAAGRIFIAARGFTMNIIALQKSDIDAPYLLITSHDDDVRLMLCGGLQPSRKQSSTRSVKPSRRAKSPSSSSNPEAVYLTSPQSSLSSWRRKEAERAA